MNLDINTYDELKEQLGGMYGVNYDKLFEDVKDDEFNLQDAIDKIANIALDEDYFKMPAQVEFDKLDDILDTIAKQPRKVLEINGKLYKIGYDGLLEGIKKRPEFYEDLNVDQFFADTKFYKFVKKAGDKYFSFFDTNFEYVIGQTAEGKLNKVGYYDRDRAGKLHFNEKNDIDNSTYKNEKGAVLLEVSIKPEDFRDVYSHVMATKCTVLREVPEDEWKQWKKIDEKEVFPFYA
jgi:hypothetical protein